MFLFIDGPALVCGWVNFPILWPHTHVQTKLKCPPPPPPPGEFTGNTSIKMGENKQRMNNHSLSRLIHRMYFAKLSVRTTAIKPSSCNIKLTGLSKGSYRIPQQSMISDVFPSYSYRISCTITVREHFGLGIRAHAKVGLKATQYAQK